MFLNSNKIRTIFKRGFLQTAWEKCLQKAVFYLPWNTQYRPKAVADIYSEPDGIELKVLERDLVSETYIPKDFDAVMLDKGYDKKTVEGEQVRMYSNPLTTLVAKIHRGRVYSDNLKTSAIITQENRLLSDVSFQYVTESSAEADSLIFKQRCFKKPTHIDGTLFVMIAGGVSGRGNYFHWLIDVVPRLQLLSQSGWLSEVDKFLVPQYDRDFQKTTLGLFGITEDQIIECDSFTHLSCDQLIAASHPRGRRSILVPDWLFTFYQEKKQLLLKAGAYPNRMYVTRKDSSLRGIEDEDRLIDYLKGYGFEPVTLAEHDFDAKVNYFNGAETIISAHGAGLTNLFFSNPGSRLLELFTEGFVDSVLLNLAERNQVDYHYLIFENPKAAHEDAKGQYEDIIIDYDKLGVKLDSLLAS